MSTYPDTYEGWARKRRDYVHDWNVVCECNAALVRIARAKLGLS